MSTQVLSSGKADQENYKEKKNALFLMKKINYLRLAHFMMCIFWLVLLKSLELVLSQ